MAEQRRNGQGTRRAPEHRPQRRPAPRPDRPEEREVRRSAGSASRGSAGARAAARRRKRRRQRMRRIIPAVLVVLLILVLAGVIVGNFLYKKYSLSKEQADLWEYYGITAENDAAIILNTELVEEKAVVLDGNIYVDTEFLYADLNERFYWDAQENLLSYALPTELVTVEAGVSEYSVGKDRVSFGYAPVRLNGTTAYVALEFIEQYTDMQYELFEDPVPRVRIITDFCSMETVAAKSDTQVRDKAGIKRPVLCQVQKDEELYVLPTDDEIAEWTRVMTKDGFIGYVQNKRLASVHGFEDITSDFVAPVYTSITKDYTINMAWHQVTNTQANENIYKVLANTKGINTISPTWFRLNDSEGGIESLASQSYVDECHRNGIEVWGLVEDITYKDTIVDYEIFSRSSSRQRLVNNLISRAIQYGLDGINLDIEYVREESSRGYVEFIRELSIMCRLNGIILSVDNYVPTAYTACYNRAEQGVFADYVVIMGYDETPKNSTTAGSVASIDFVRSGIENTLLEVPAEKVINGIPFYTRLWKVTPSNAEGSVDGYIASCEAEVGMDTAANYVAQNGAEANWSEIHGQYYAEYEQGDSTYMIWLEEERSIEEKCQLIKDYELAGVAEWKIGFERSTIWDVILRYVN